MRLVHPDRRGIDLCCENPTEAIRRRGRRSASLDRARTLITLLVLLHHSVVNYTYFGSGDKMRWLGFDLVVLFNDWGLLDAMRPSAYGIFLLH